MTFILLFKNKINNILFLDKLEKNKINHNIFPKIIKKYIVKDKIYFFSAGKSEIINIFFKIIKKNEFKSIKRLEKILYNNVKFIYDHHKETNLTMIFKKKCYDIIINEDDVLIKKNYNNIIILGPYNLDQIIHKLDSIDSVISMTIKRNSNIYNGNDLHEALNKVKLIKNIFKNSNRFVFNNNEKYFEFIKYIEYILYIFNKYDLLGSPSIYGFDIIDITTDTLYQINSKLIKIKCD